MTAERAAAPAGNESPGAAAAAAAAPPPPDAAAQDPVSLGEALQRMADKVGGWVEDLVVSLPNIAAAALVVIAAGLIARVVRKLVRKGMVRVRAPVQVAALAGAVASVVVMAAGLFAALGVLGLEKTVTSLLAGAGIVGLAISFAFQDIATNFIAGVYLAVKRPLSVGDVVETNGFFGTVRAINLRSLELQVPQGMIVRIPNKMVFENPFTDYSTGEQRIDLRSGVSYADDLPRAREVAIAAIEGVTRRLAGRPVEFFWEAIGDSSINFVVRFWIEYRVQTDMLAAQSEAIERLKVAFDAAGITMPYPIQTLDFGVAGGEKLSEQLTAWRPRETAPEKPSR
jgi:small conductance mechanosensitive channel